MTDPRPAFPPATILGYPRIGRRRELKRAIEAHWRGASDEATLERTAAELRRATRERRRRWPQHPIGDTPCRVSRRTGRRSSRTPTIDA